MMEDGREDSGNEDIAAAASEEPAIDVDQPPPSPEQEHRLQFHEQRSESPATEAVLLDSQSEGSRRESDSHSHACVTVSPPASPGKQTADSREEDGLDVPKPKPQLDPREENKRLDLESPISGPGRRRNVAAVEEPDQTHLKVSITDREKHGTKTDTYVIYKICTDANSHFENPHYEVWRRYRDFEWLRDQIEKMFPTLIVPPLPGKQLVRYFDHMNDVFLKERQKALEKFLHRLVAHPFFSFDQDVKIFLTAADEDFSVRLGETVMVKGTKLLDMVSSSVKQAATSLRLRNIDAEFVREAKYFSDLSEKLCVMEKVGNRLHEEREELLASQEDFSTVVFQWSMLEPKITQPLQKLANCVDNCNTTLKSLNEANTFSLLMPMREYQLYCTSATSAIKRRDVLQLEQERTAEERDKRKKAHDDALSAGKVQKIPKLAEDLEKAGIAAERSLDALTRANEQLRVDIENWHEATNREMSQLMRGVADNHVEYHQKCFEEWEKILKLLKSTVQSVEKEAECEAAETEALTDSTG